MLQKEPPAVTKAQRPVQRVMMKMGPRLASYQGFRNVWGGGGQREPREEPPPHRPEKNHGGGQRGTLEQSPRLNSPAPR